MLNFLITPLMGLIVFFYSQTNSFGLAILLLTLVLRFLLLPLSIASLRTQKKMQLIQPKLKELEKKHGKNNDQLRLAQVELYREHKINPLAGLLPALIQLVPLLAVYQVLQRFLENQELIAQGGAIFLGINLTQRDNTLILPILAAGFSLLQSLMILPGLESHDLVPEQAKAEKVHQANQKETQNQDAAAAVQKQMVFMMPVMTGLFAAGFPAGLALYWVATTVFGIIQQYFFSGLGGLEEYLVKFGLIKKKTPPVANITNLAEALALVENKNKPKLKKPKKIIKNKGKLKKTNKKRK